MRPTRSSRRCWGHGTTSPKALTISSWPDDRVPGSDSSTPDEGGDHRGPAPIRRHGRRRAGGRRGRGRRRRPARHRAAQSPVAAVHDLDPGARRAAGRGGTARPAGGRDERRTIQDRGFPRRSDRAAVRVLRRGLAGQDRRVHGRFLLLGREGPRGPVVLDRPVRHERRGHGGLVPPGRRAQALGGNVRRVQPRPASEPVDRPADGGLVPKEDQYARRLQGSEDAHPGPRRPGGRARRAARSFSRRRARSMPPSSEA